MKRHSISDDVKVLGFRSRLEVTVNKQLLEMGANFAYEGSLNKIRYTYPAEKHTYLADFLLSNGIIIEAKGVFDAKDRKKHVYIKEQFPELDIRFVFMRSSNKITKKSRTRYSDWCDKNDILWCDKLVPQSWVDEVKPKAELDAIIAILKEMNK